MIAKAPTLTWTMKLSAQDRSRSATNKAVDGREGVSVGMPEVSEPATQHRIDRRNDALDRIAPVALGQGTDSCAPPAEVGDEGDGENDARSGFLVGAEGMDDLLEAFHVVLLI
ncbi:hypothetical protein [Cupriavidus basilensis]